MSYGLHINHSETALGLAVGKNIWSKFHFWTHRQNRQKIVKNGIFGVLIAN